MVRRRQHPKLVFGVVGLEVLGSQSAIFRVGHSDLSRSEHGIEGPSVS